MKRSEKWYFKLKHHCLTKERLTTEQFDVLTGLTQEEIESYFKQSSRHIKNRLIRLGKVARYQKSKKAEISSDWLVLSRELGKKLCMYSDSIGIKSINQEANDLEYGLALLAAIERRKGIIWSIRLRMVMPEFSIKVASVPRLTHLFNQLNND
ncbi:hypothetical protein VCSRO185_3457 [Vibrio cholerae]|nr:hypothetical protein VCSRO185_3457 [Vibrio cholerae]